MAKEYRNVTVRAFAGAINWASDTLMWTLHTSTYVPNADTHVFVSDLTNELATGGGYTSGGLAASGKSVTYITANSWTVSRAASTTYAVADVVRPATGNGFLYRATTAGASGASLPTYSTVIGSITTDGAINWECVGSGAVVLAVASPTWPAATFGPCRIAVLSDRQTGVAATEPLLCYVDFVTDRTAGNGNFTITVNGVQGVVIYFTI